MGKKNYKYKKNQYMQKLYTPNDLEEQTIILSKRIKQCKYYERKVIYVN